MQKLENRGMKNIIMAKKTKTKTKISTTKLSQDLATLINNRQGSDVQFKVGGGDGTSIQNGETIYDESATVTIYAHSAILRCRSQYFATMLDEEKNWRECSKGVIYKPNISSSTFQDVLYYIYTGNVPDISENIVELIAAAEEMDLEELSVGCQTELISTIKKIFSDEDDIIRGRSKRSTKQRIPIDVAINTHIIPALDLTNSHSLSCLSQKLLEIITPNISVIVKSPDAYTTFINDISSEDFTKIIASDDLAITEREIWELVLSWACNQTNLQKFAVEARITSLEKDDEDDKESLDIDISDIQLNELKTTLAPLLSAIRFRAFTPDDYAQMNIILNFFLPRYQYVELDRYFMSITQAGHPDAPEIESKIVVESATWEFLGMSIFNARDIASYTSLKHPKFNLLFRASEHNFAAKAFHEMCDKKGPTLTLVKSADGHVFGGVNFAHWMSNSKFSCSSQNFLFALPGGYRQSPRIFKKTKSNYSCFNRVDLGPTFGRGYDLCIADSANSNNNSHSRLPRDYNGHKASNTALAGASNFTVSDYEVFAISKKDLYM